MPEVKIRYKEMTDEELDTVAEAMADMIICHIQDRKNRERNGKRIQKSKKSLPERSDGTVQPV